MSYREEMICKYLLMFEELGGKNAWGYVDDEGVCVGTPSWKIGRDWLKVNVA